MAELATTRSRFQMAGTRAVIIEDPFAEAIELQINAIENALESVPDFAFDLAKTLVETVCKTMLADLGQPADPGWDAPKLLKETTNKITLLPRDHPNPTKAEESVKKTIRGLQQTIQGLCELRNGYGMASHGRDARAARLGLQQATLAAQAADTIASFLYRTHRDARAQKPGDRVYYDDHADFNDVFDRENDMIYLGGIPLLPSRVLFHTDPEAYKAALNDFLAVREGTGNDEDEAGPQGEEELTP